ncbi:MAG: hypothetical protein WA786_09610 [Acidimicrobiales bacterium]
MKRVLVPALAVAVYAWWASGVAPFTTLAYVLVAVATACVAAGYGALGALSPQRHDIARYYRLRAEDPSFARWAPWMAVVMLALTLEIVGLALGGRSATVPTVSTMLDHLLLFHWSRAVLYFLWFSVGIWPIVRLSRRSRRGEPQ